MAGQGEDELAPYVLSNADVTGLRRLGESKGSGAYGAVYEVTVKGVLCIAKRLHAILMNEEVSQAEKASIQRQFRQECVLLSKLNHPNIVHFIGIHYGKDRSDLSLIMERLHTNLAKFLEPTEPKDARDIPLSVKISILLDVVYGLHYMHSLSPPVLHRDLSANNILLTSCLRDRPEERPTTNALIEFLKDLTLHHPVSYDDVVKSSGRDISNQESRYRQERDRA